MSVFLICMIVVAGITFTTGAALFFAYCLKSKAVKEEYYSNKRNKE